MKTRGVDELKQAVRIPVKKRQLRQLTSLSKEEQSIRNYLTDLPPEEFDHVVKQLLEAKPGQTLTVKNSTVLTIPKIWQPTTGLFEAQGSLYQALKAPDLLDVIIPSVEAILAKEPETSASLFAQEDLQTELARTKINELREQLELLQHQPQLVEVADWIRYEIVRLFRTIADYKNPNIVKIEFEKLDSEELAHDGVMKWISDDYIYHLAYDYLQRAASTQNTTLITHLFISEVSIDPLAVDHVLYQGSVELYTKEYSTKRSANFDQQHLTEMAAGRITKLGPDYDLKPMLTFDEYYRQQQRTNQVLQQAAEVAELEKPFEELARAERSLKIWAEKEAEATASFSSIKNEEQELSEYFENLKKKIEEPASETSKKEIENKHGELSGAHDEEAQLAKERAHHERMQMKGELATLQTALVNARAAKASAETELKEIQGYVKEAQEAVLAASQKAVGSEARAEADQAAADLAKKVAAWRNPQEEKYTPSVPAKVETKPASPEEKEAAAPLVTSRTSLLRVFLEHVGAATGAGAVVGAAAGFAMGIMFGAMVGFVIGAAAGAVMGAILGGIAVYYERAKQLTGSVERPSAAVPATGHPALRKVSRPGVAQAIEPVKAKEVVQEAKHKEVKRREEQQSSSPRPGQRR